MGVTIALETGDPDEAERVRGEIHARWPPQAVSENGILAQAEAELWRRRGDRARGLALLEAVPDGREVTRPGCHLLRAVLLRELGRHEEAARSFERGQQLARQLVSGPDEFADRALAEARGLFGDAGRSDADQGSRVTTDSASSS